MATGKTLVVYSNEKKNNPELPEIKNDTTVAVVNDNLADEVVKDTDVTVDGPSTDKTSGLPIDRGWAWVVLAAATFYLILFGGIKRNLGIVFIEFQSRFGSSASLTSLLTTMQNVLLSVCSLLVMTVGMQFMSSRTSIILGSLFLTTANIITAFATDIRILFVSVGMLEGVGNAMIVPLVTATLGEYFNKRRGFANGIASSGVSCGGLIFAPIVSTLFESYGYTGTLLIFAGMTLNACVTGALLRPIHSFEKKASKLTSDQNDKPLKPEMESFINNGSVNSKHVKSTDDIISHLVLHSEKNEDLPNKAVLKLKTAGAHHCLLRWASHEAVLQKDSLTGSPLLSRPRAWSTGNRRQRTVSTISETSAHTHAHISLSPMNSLVESLSRSRVALYSSIEEGFYGPIVDIQKLSVNQTEVTKKPAHKPTICEKLKSSFDLSLLKNPVFPMFLCMTAMFSPSCVLLPAVLAPHGKDIKLTMEQRGLLLSVIGGTGVGARVTCALIADRKMVKLTTIFAFMAALVGLTAHMLRFFTGFGGTMSVAVIIGLTCDVYLAMYPVIVVEYLTLPRLKSCLGFTTLCHGFALAGTFPIVGLLRDATGDYFASYHLLGTMQLIGGCIALSIPYVHKRFQSQENKLMSNNV